MRDNNFRSAPIENRKAAVTLDSFASKRGAPLFKGIASVSNVGGQVGGGGGGEAHNGAH